MADMKKGRKDVRIGVINVVQTPLKFFVLMVLVVEAMFLAVAGMCREQNRMNVFCVMAFIIVLLILVVAIIAFFRPETLYGIRASEHPSENLANLLSDTIGRELLRAVFRDCVEEYATGHATTAEIEAKYGLKKGTVAELAKITTFISAYGRRRRPPGRES